MTLADAVSDDTCKNNCVLYMLLLFQMVSFATEQSMAWEVVGLIPYPGPTLGSGVPTYQSSISTVSCWPDTIYLSHDTESITF